MYNKALITKAIITMSEVNTKMNKKIIVILMSLLLIGVIFAATTTVSAAGDKVRKMQNDNYDGNGGVKNPYNPGTFPGSRIRPRAGVP